MQNGPLKGMTFEEALMFIFNYFGEETQLNKLKEEFMEFVEAIELGDVNKIEEEGVDLFILIFQWIVSKGASQDNMQRQASYKMARVLERIANGEYDQYGKYKAAETAAN